MISMRQEESYKDSVHILHVNDSRWRDKERSNEKNLVLLLPVFHFNVERQVCESTKIYT
jgi:hypothetical protein